jgi:hypothetical protein
VSEMKRLRFPYIPAAICAACLVVAGWTWMRYSWAWDATTIPADRVPVLHGRYVVVHGQVERAGSSDSADVAAVLHGHSGVVHVGPGGTTLWTLPLVGATTSADGGKDGAICGRLVLMDSLPIPFTDAPAPPHVALDVRASRVTWHSITGLVVGALGIGVFMLFVRRWLTQRGRIVEGREVAAQRDGGKAEP